MTPPTDLSEVPTFAPSDYESAIVELMEFVTTHLDSDPIAQWAGYVTSPGAVRVVAHTQINHILAGLSREPIQEAGR